MEHETAPPSPERPGEPAIREYTAADQPGFERLVHSVHAEFGYGFDPLLDADLDDPAKSYRKVWVLEGTDSEVHGSVALREAGEGLELKRMYLRPEDRDQGHGRSLLHTAVAWAQAHGYRHIDLDTAEHQSDAQRLYEAAGFQLVGRSDTSDAWATRYYRLSLPHGDGLAGPLAP